MLDTGHVAQRASVSLLTCVNRQTSEKLQRSRIRQNISLGSDESKHSAIVLSLHSAAAEPENKNILALAQQKKAKHCSSVIRESVAPAVDAVANPRKMLIEVNDELGDMDEIFVQQKYKRLDEQQCSLLKAVYVSQRGQFAPA